jgi:hypothetical protein
MNGFNNYTINYSLWCQKQEMSVEVRTGHRESQIKGPHFLPLASQRVIICFFILRHRYDLATLTPSKNKMSVFIIEFQKARFVMFRSRSWGHGVSPNSIKMTLKLVFEIYAWGFDWYITDVYFNGQSAFLWIPTVLFFSTTCSLIHTKPISKGQKLQFKVVDLCEKKRISVLH